MSGTAKTEVAQQIIKETSRLAEEINNIQHGKITFIVQSGKVQRAEFNKSIAAK
jgi:Uncharacterized small protein (DUF2292).